jgi:hypothetical protein
MTLRLVVVFTSWNALYKPDRIVAKDFL